MTRMKSPSASLLAQTQEAYFSVRHNTLLRDLVARGLDSDDIKRYYLFLYSYLKAIPRNDEQTFSFGGLKPLHTLLAENAASTLKKVREAHNNPNIRTFCSMFMAEHVEGMKRLVKAGLVVKALPKREIEAFPDIYTPDQIEWLKKRPSDKKHTYQPAFAPLSQTRGTPCLVTLNGQQISLYAVASLLWWSFGGAIEGPRPTSVDENMRNTMLMFESMGISPDLIINAVHEWKEHGGDKHETKGLPRRKK